MNDFEYMYDEEYGGIVFGQYKGNPTEAVIPDTIEGKPVVKIRDHAFCDCTKLTKITIPDSVREIGSFAFWWSFHLAEVTISDSVAKIDKHVFLKQICIKHKGETYDFEKWQSLKRY